MRVYIKSYEISWNKSAFSFVPADHLIMQDGKARVCPPKASLCLMGLETIHFTLFYCCIVLPASAIFHILGRKKYLRAASPGI